MRIGQNLAAPRGFLLSCQQETGALALRLDRLADAELQHGHHSAAEQLAHRAAALRDALQ